MNHLKLFENREEPLFYDFVDDNTELIQDTISKLANPEYANKLQQLNDSFGYTEYETKLYKKTFLYYPKTYVLDVVKRG